MKDLKMRFFDISEFDSPDKPGSGEMMDRDFLLLLDEARDIAGIPFRIGSGFRTPEWHADLTRRGYKTAKNSPHLLGLAADITVTNSRERWLVMDALLTVGIVRLGIGENFIHCDIDDHPKKSQHIIWTYY